MNRPHRSIEIFTMSALDLFVTAMGSFAILMMILFPYFKKDRKKRAEEQQGHVLMCAWPTRVQDYEAFKKDTASLVPAPVIEGQNRRNVIDEDSWKEPGYEQEPTFPVVTVTWTEAQAFCQWLTRKERASNTIPPEAEYRLPTLAEWRAAMGSEKYPWGNAWPPPPKTANLGGEEYSRGRGYSSASPDMKGYEDNHEMASPVGSYAPNRDGLYDVAGNVRVWLEDWFRKDMLPKPSSTYDDGGGQKYRAYAGSTWEVNSKELIETTQVFAAVPERRHQSIGFRCVLDLKPASRTGSNP